MKEEDSIFLEYGEIRRGPGQSRAVSLVCDAALQSEDERSKATLAPSSSDASEFAWYAAAIHHIVPRYHHDFSFLPTPPHLYIHIRILPIMPTPCLTSTYAHNPFVCNNE